MCAVGMAGRRLAHIGCPAVYDYHILIARFFQGGNFFATSLGDSASGRWFGFASPAFLTTAQAAEAPS